MPRRRISLTLRKPSVCTASCATEARTAYVRQQAAVISVCCGVDDAGAAWVEVSDTGDGLPTGFDARVDGGLGFRILRALSAQLGAAFDFEPTFPGTRFRLVLPTP